MAAPLLWLLFPVLASTGRLLQQCGLSAALTQAPLWTLAPAPLLFLALFVLRALTVLMLVRLIAKLATLGRSLVQGHHHFVLFAPLGRTLAMAPHPALSAALAPTLRLAPTIAKRATLAATLPQVLVLVHSVSWVTTHLGALRPALRVPLLSFARLALPAATPL